VFGDLKMKINEVVNEGFWSTLLTPKAISNLPDMPDRGSQAMSDCQARAKARELYGDDIDPSYEQDCLGKKIAPAPDTTTSSTMPDLHPDVSVISSYPLRLKYKNGDFVLDPGTNKWMTVSGKAVAPTLSSFLQFQANKL
jgi:hypothetical protein